jgi:hypothetical protein
MTEVSAADLFSWVPFWEMFVTAAINSSPP